MPDSSEMLEQITIEAPAAHIRELQQVLGAVATQRKFSIRYVEPSAEDIELQHEIAEPLYNPELVTWTEVQPSEPLIPLITEDKLIAFERSSEDWNGKGRAKRSFSALMNAALPKSINSFDLNPYIVARTGGPYGIRADRYGEMLEQIPLVTIRHIGPRNVDFLLSVLVHLYVPENERESMQ